jgi:CheY-like chemotaxis protein
MQTAEDREDDGLFGLAGRRVLLVEDNLQCACAVRAWLEICGATVRTAHSIGQALRRMREEAPDLVLVDLRLPDGSGWELLDRARTSVPGAARIPVVAIAGIDRAATVGMARAHGVRHVLTKPIAPAALADALSDCLTHAA